MALAAVAGIQKEKANHSETTPLQFIDLTVQSTHSSQQNRQLIRSHIAKSNRRRRAQGATQREVRQPLQKRPIVPSQVSVVHGEQVTRPEDEQPIFDSTMNAEHSPSWECTTSDLYV